MEGIPLIPKCRKVTFDTGNIITWSRLKKKPLVSGTDEVLDSTDSLTKCWLNQQDDLRPLQYIEELQVQCPLHHCVQGRQGGLEQEERDEMRVNVKLTVWLDRYCRGAVKEAVQAALASLGAKDCDGLVLSVAGASLLDEELVLEDVKPLWAELEELQAQDALGCLGVADFPPDLLEELHAWASVKPHICQLHTRAACATPLRLRQFASANRIQLLTHSDGADPLPTERLRHALAGAFSPMDADGWQPNWLARVSASYRHRGVVKSWGYVFQLAREL